MLNVLKKEFLWVINKCLVVCIVGDERVEKRMTVIQNKTNKQSNKQTTAVVTTKTRTIKVTSFLNFAFSAMTKEA